MNKVWKQKWKEQRLYDGHENPGGFGSSVPSPGPSEPHPPLDSQPTVPSAHPSKRSQASLDSTSLPPSKRLKTAVHAQIVVEPEVDPSISHEVVLLYDKFQGRVETDLFRRIRLLDSSEATFPRQFKEARRVAAELGTCAADLVWRRALKNIDENISLSSEEEEADAPSDLFRKTKLNIRDTIKHWAFTIPNLDPNSRGFNVTPKFWQLVQILKSCEPYGEDFRGIVFVKHRSVACAIADLVPLLGEQIPFIRTHALANQGGLLVDDSQQQDVFRKFKAGIYNLLVATKSVEDLDIPKAMIVVRFDVFECDISYSFNRSLTSEKASYLVHMLERGNSRHRRHMARISEFPSTMARWANILRSCPTSSAPPCYLRPPRHSENSDTEDESTECVIENPTTGGRIYSQDATAVIYRIASAASSKPFPSPIFDFHSAASNSTAAESYTCTIVAPGTPAHNITGQPCSSMAHARRSACYDACVQMTESGLLESSAFLFPSPHPTTQGSNSARKPQKVDQPTGTGDQIYPRKLPRFWSKPTGAAKKLFPLIITVTHSNQPPHTPLLLLTRFSLPNFPPFKLFVSGAPIVVETYTGTPFAIDNEKLSSLHIYTLRLCRAMANKPFNCLIEEMPYFLAPISSTWIPSSQDADQRREVADHIPWDLVAQAALSWTKPLRYGCLEDITEDVQDAVVQDRSAEMTRRYDVLRVRPDLSPLSHPEDSPREAEYSSLLEYCKAVRKNFEGLKNETQALIEVSSIMSGISRLDPASRPPVKNGPPPPRYLIPELCFKSTVPASTFRTALLFPSITRRFDGFLLVKELNARLFDHQISETLLDQAIAAPSTRIEYDYERLELLGDAVLKYMASIYVFVVEPSNTEGALHTARQLIISNSALFLSFGRSGLPAYVQSKPFTIKSWQPPNFKISEENEKAQSNRQKKENEQRLGDKISADVAEAILGAAYLSGGVDTALAAAKAMNIPFPCADTWSDFSDRLLIPPPTISAKLKNGALEAVEVIIHHKFEHPHILSQALTHASLAGFDRVSYERLEFLGDAILEFLVLRHVYERYPKVSPGGLTMLKGAMVSNSTLAAICVLSGLHQHILLASHFANSVSEYISRLKLKRSEEYELARLEERSPGQYWQETDPPKALSDVVESVIGAVYVSDKCSPVGVEAFFEHVLKPFYDEHISLKTVAHHPTKVLFELIQAHKCQKFQLLKEKTAGRTQCQVLVHDVVLASGEGASASIAARNASWCALDALEGDSEFLRICDCPKTLEAKRRNSKAIDELLSGLEE